MTNENPLLMNRTQFPVMIAKGCEDLCENESAWDIIYPPVHPSIINTGIILERASEVIDEAVADSLEDLSKMAEKVPSVNTFLESLRDPKTNKFIVYRKDGMRRLGNRIEISPFSLDTGFSQLNIKKEGLYFGGGSSGSASTFSPTKDNHGNFPFQYYKHNMSSLLLEQLVKEYELRPVEKAGEIIGHISHNFWRWHNLYCVARKVFCKNFAIAYNNSVIEDKYLLKR